MKKTLLTTVLISFISISIFGQSPQSMNYQAVLRDDQGQILANKDVEIVIAILQGNTMGVEVFSEIHSVTTNNFGLANLQIGSVNTSGMENIDWSSGPYFVQISVDGTVMGTSQLLSVPYALHANTVENDKVEDDDADPGNEIQDISLNGNELSISEGSTVDLSGLTGGTDYQKLFFYDDKYLEISHGNVVKLPYLLKEVDGSNNNEIQSLSISNDTIFLTKGGSVKLPAEAETHYIADSSYIKTKIRNLVNSVANTISAADTSLWNDKTYISDSDNDTKVLVEETPDEDVLHMSVAGDEFFNADTEGVEFILPTNDGTSNLKVKKSNGDVVFGVDGYGLMNGDGSGLSNVKSLANSAGGNLLCQITKNYAWYQNVKSVTLQTPSSGKCFVMASGYIRWESKGWDLLLSSILRNTDPNESWDAENEFFRYLNLSTDYNCTDSSDQYVGFAQHRCFNVGAGTQTFTLWANKYSSSAKVRVDDVNITVLFFPTAGTGSGTLKSTQLEAEEQQTTERFTSIARRPDGGELRQRLDAMINKTRDNEEVPDSGLIILQKSVEELKAENEKLKQEKSETDKRLSEIEKRIKLLMNSDKLNH